MKTTKVTNQSPGMRLVKRTMAIVVFGLLLAGCGSGGSSSCTNPPGTYTTNVGQFDVGGGGNINVGPNNTDYIGFDNTRLLFGTVYGGLIADVGQVDCLSDITAMPLGANDSAKTAIVGDSYVVEFYNSSGAPDGNYARFTFDSYNNGTATVTVAPGL